MNWKGREGGGIEGRNRYLAGIRTEARAASRTHFYGSGMWVNVPKGRYNAFSRAVRSSVLIRVKELNPFNSGLDHVRSLSGMKGKLGTRSLSYN